MKVAIVGYGLQGRSSYEYFKGGNDVTIHDIDTRISLPKNVVSILGPDYLSNLNEYDLIVRSPKVHPLDIASANGGSDILSKVTTNTNEFLRIVGTKNVIGVTGTKGKGTTSTLIYKLLESSGKKAYLGGNIGTPPLELLKNDLQPTDLIVLELANFQLIDIKYSPHIAVCLMVEQEHLDWHKSFEEYVQSKSQMFNKQTDDDIAVFFSRNDYSKQIASSGKAKLIPYFMAPGALIDDEYVSIGDSKIVKLSDIKLLGKHNLENICAALTTYWQIEQNAEAAKSAISSFSGLPYRLELVDTHNGVKYFNDSFASAPPASIAAMESVEGKKVLIIGGKDRGLELKNLMIKIKEHQKDIRKLVLIGESRERLKYELEQMGYDNYTVYDGFSMREIAMRAGSYARPGDSVILSPGFPSFDMFKNFEDRGQQYNEAVKSL